MDVDFVQGGCCLLEGDVDFCCLFGCYYDGFVVVFVFYRIYVEGVGVW